VAFDAVDLQWQLTLNSSSVSSTPRSCLCCSPEVLVVPLNYY
jgi:hypothetical protein